MAMSPMILALAATAALVNTAAAFQGASLPMSLRAGTREVTGLRSTKLSTSADFESRRSLLAKGLLLVGAAATSVPLKTKAEALEDYKIYQILQECKSIPGSFRYVAVTAGGVVLETAGSLDINYVGPYELTYPPYGMFMTLAGPNSDKHLEAKFECTIPLDKVTGMAFDVLDGPEGPLYVIRLKKEGEKKSILSIMLGYDLEANGGKSGKYTPGAVDKWTALRKKFADANGDIAL